MNNIEKSALRAVIRQLSNCPNDVKLVEFYNFLGHSPDIYNTIFRRLEKQYPPTSMKNIRRFFRIWFKKKYEAGFISEEVYNQYYAVAGVVTQPKIRPVGMTYQNITEQFRALPVTQKHYVALIRYCGLSTSKISRIEAIIKMNTDTYSVFVDDQQIYCPVKHALIPAADNVTATGVQYHVKKAGFVATRLRASFYADLERHTNLSTIQTYCGIMGTQKKDKDAPLSFHEWTALLDKLYGDI